MIYFVSPIPQVALLSDMNCLHLADKVKLFYAHIKEYTVDGKEAYLLHKLSFIISATILGVT